MINIRELYTKNKNRIILVAGGAGFIGSHLCNRLIMDKYNVMCIDNLYTGSTENIRHLLDNPRFTFVHHDVTQPMSYDDDASCENRRKLYRTRQSRQSGRNHSAGTCRKDNGIDKISITYSI